MPRYKIMCKVWTADRSDYISGEYIGCWYKRKETAIERLLIAQQKHKDDPLVELYIKEEEDD